MQARAETTAVGSLSPAATGECGPSSPATSRTLRRLSSTSLRCSLPELLGVLAPSVHSGPPFLACAKSGGVPPTGVTSVRCLDGDEHQSAPRRCPHPQAKQ